MEPYQYIIRPVGGSSTNFMAQAKYRETIDNAALYAEIQSRLGATPLTIENVLRVACETIIDLGIQGYRIAPIADLIGFMYGCGGSHPTSDFAPTYENLNMDLRGHTGETGLARAKAAFSAEKVGEQGRVVPVIVRVTDAMTGLQNHYTPGKSLQVELANRNCVIDPASDYQGVFFRNAATGVTVKASDYGLVKGQNIICVAPAGLTGAQELSVAGTIKGSLRTGIYAIPVLP